MIHFYCLRHAHPATEEGDLDSLGYEQIRATAATHLQGVHFRFSATSDKQRALSSLTMALGDHSRSVVTYNDQEKIGYEWLLGDTRLPKWKRPKPKPTNALELVERWAPALVLGLAMWEHLTAIAKAELWMPFYGKAMTKEDESRTVECNALIAGHSGIIEAMAAATANQGVPLAKVPILGHADILRITAQWMVDDHEISPPCITAITHLSCPIKTPA